jgi:hypothetical protein
MIAGALLDRIATLLELVRERRAIVRTDLSCRAEDRPGGKRHDPPVLSDRIRDDDMAVQMRVRRVARKDPAGEALIAVGPTPWEGQVWGAYAAAWIAQSRYSS